MKVQTVTIEIHEKRNHPNAYGHYDARVNYTVQIDEGEDAQEIVGRYQFVARQQVADECDRWEREIKLEESRESARGNLRWIVERTESGNLGEYGARDFEKNLGLLPIDEHTEWRTKLADAQAQWQKTVKAALDELVAYAGQKELRPYQVDRWEANIAQLPDYEQEEYMNRLTTAKAAYEASQAPVTKAIEDDKVSGF